MEKISKNKIKFLRSLNSKKNRDKEQLFLLEGEKMVREAVQSSAHLVQEVYVQKGTEMSWLKDFKAVYEINTTESDQISTFKSPNKCLALLKFPEVQIKNEKFTLVLDQVQDPGNLGTILRLADWFGIDDVVCSIDTADCFNPKVVQATMGSLFRIKVRYTNLVNYLKQDARIKYGAVMNGDNVYKTTLSKEAILIMGNEGNGISKEIGQLINSQLTIPKLGQAESLNVANATGILLSEFFRT